METIGRRTIKTGTIRTRKMKMMMMKTGTIRMRRPTEEAEEGEEDEETNL